MKIFFFLLCCGIALCSPWKTVSDRSDTVPAVKAEPPAPDTISFTAQIQPILQAKCNPCHFPGGKMYEKMPFDRAQTVLDHAEGMARRLHEGEEGKLLQAFISQAQR